MKSSDIKNAAIFLLLLFGVTTLAYSSDYRLLIADITDQERQGWAYYTYDPANSSTELIPVPSLSGMSVVAVSKSGDSLLVRKGSQYIYANKDGEVYVKDLGTFEPYFGFTIQDSGISFFAYQTKSYLVGIQSLDFNSGIISTPVGPLYKNVFGRVYYDTNDNVLIYRIKDTSDNKKIVRWSLEESVEEVVVDNTGYSVFIGITEDRILLTDGEHINTYTMEGIREETYTVAAAEALFHPEESLVAIVTGEIPKVVIMDTTFTSEIDVIERSNRRIITDGWIDTATLSALESWAQSK